MISIVIPALNESSSIGLTIQSCRATMEAQNIEYEVIVVDDGSSDDTYNIAIENGAKVVSHPHNVGYGRSLKDGILTAKFDTIVITDADGTYPVDRIPDLYGEYQQGFDMVVGARTGKNYDESTGKKILRIILKNLVEYTAGRNIPDINSGLRIFSKQKATPYYRFLCDTFSFTTSLTLAYMMNGMFVKYIPIEYHKRVGTISKVKLFRDSLRTLQFIVEAMLYYNPIKVFLALSFITFVLGLLLLIIGLFFYSQIAINGFINLTITSIFIFVVGLISVQLKQLLHIEK
jgi:glycosyltransferase involved in cell wall biosynthesis